MTRPTADPDVTWTPMVVPPPQLECGLPRPGMVKAADLLGRFQWAECCYIHEARTAYGMEVPPVLHVHYVPDGVEAVGVSQWSVEAAGYVVDLSHTEPLEDRPGIGLPFHPRFATHLDSPRELMPAKLREYRVKCAGKHSVWPDHRGRVLCSLLLDHTVKGGRSVTQAADRETMTPDRAAAHLLEALSLIWRWRARSVNGLDGHRRRAA